MEGQVETALRFRNLAEELRLLASGAKDDRNREALMRAAENYDRVALSYDAIERTRAVLASQGSN
jgi:purine nucleoside permease